MGAAASKVDKPKRGHGPGVGDEPKCGARTKSRNGGSCLKTAGWGTDHVGYGHCKLHGGSAPNGQIFAAKLQAAALALEYQVEPHEALLRAVGQAAKWELICRLKVSELDDDHLAVRHEKTNVEYSPILRRDNADDEALADLIETGATIVERRVETTTSTDLNVWVKAHVQAVRDLASISKTAIDAGVEERRVRVAEALGGQLADVLGAIFNELQLTPEQRQAARPVVQRHLELLEGGQRELTA